MQQPRHGDFQLTTLTAKQRQVLDLLIQHKTSKEIARRLGISPHTVDQRIQFARDKLGANTRSEAAVAYRRLVETCDELTYQESGIVHGAGPCEEAGGSSSPLPWPLGPSTLPGSRSVAEADFRVVPELFDGRYGTMFRLGSIFVIAVLMVILLLGGMAIYAQLSQLLGR